MDMETPERRFAKLYQLMRIQIRFVLPIWAWRIGFLRSTMTTATEVWLHIGPLLIFLGENHNIDQQTPTQIDWEELCQEHPEYTTSKGGHGPWCAHPGCKWGHDK